MSKPSTKQSSLTEEQRAVIPFVQSSYKQSVTMVAIGYALIGFCLLLDSLQANLSADPIVAYWAQSKRAVRWFFVTSQIPQSQKFVLGVVFLALAIEGLLFCKLANSHVNKKTLKHLTMCYILASLLSGISIFCVGMLDLIVLLLQLMSVIELRTEYTELAASEFCRLSFHAFVMIPGAISILVRLLPLKSAIYYMAEQEKRSTEPIIHPSKPVHHTGNPFAADPSNPFYELGSNPFEDDQPILPKLESAFGSESRCNRGPQKVRMSTKPSVSAVTLVQRATQPPTNPFLDEEADSNPVLVVYPQPSRCLWASLS